MYKMGMLKAVRFSPHTWRCFHYEEFGKTVPDVFSTHVEVFLFKMKLILNVFSFLHTRGGVSPLTAFSTAALKFSPHTWRCFFLILLPIILDYVFSTHVEVFPSGCL